MHHMKNNFTSDYAKYAAFQQEIISSLTMLTKLLLGTITNYTCHADIQYYLTNNFSTDYANYTNFRDYVENSLITNCADYGGIQYYMEKKLITDWTNYFDFEYQIYFHH